MGTHFLVFTETSLHREDEKNCYIKSVYFFFLATQLAGS